MYEIAPDSRVLQKKVHIICILNLIFPRCVCLWSVADFLLTSVNPRRQYRRTCETAGKSGKQIERCVIASSSLILGKKLGAIFRV